MVASKPSISTSASSSTAPRPHFATLEPRLKKISQSTIQRKWKPLPTSSQDKVRQMLLNIMAKRSGSSVAGGALARVPPAGGGRTRREGKTRGAKKAVEEDEYEKAVEEIADKLVTRLPRMPFPPTPTSSADDTPFDLSHTLHRVTALQTQLATNVQSARLLRRQIAREQRALKRDRAELAGLEAALQRSGQVRRRKQRGLHPLAVGLEGRVEAEADAGAERGDDDDDDDDDDGGVERAADVEGIERVDAIAGITAGRRSRGSKSTFMSTSTSMSVAESKSWDPPLTLQPQPGDADPRLDPLLAQLRSHLGSMQNNVAGMRPVVAAVEDAKMALDLYVADRLDRTALRRLYGLKDEDDDTR